MEHALVTVTEFGTHDETARATIGRRFRGHIAQRRYLHVVDLRGLPALDTPALQALVIANRVVREAGGAVRLVVDSQSMRETLALTAFDRIFRIHASVEGAIAALESSQRLSA
ncbi:MAG TPA: STAS domain-containing protein [Candidatus Eremiobacteraceae bacterium]|jgi:anti-anti-sigma factor|nr:STAS domain-containing protein [Candidatus Eremiobacteraceae bacterium]